MDKVIQRQHMGLINMEMVRREYLQFRNERLRTIGINPNKCANEKLAQFTDYYEEERHKSCKDYSVSQIAECLSHHHMLEGKLAGKYTVFSDGIRVCGVAGWLDREPFTTKLFILGEGNMKEYTHATISLPLSKYWLQLWNIELLEFFQGSDKEPIDKYNSTTTFNPDIYKHCINKAEFKQFCQRCEMLELLKL